MLSHEWYVQNEDYPTINDHSEVVFDDDGVLSVSCNDDVVDYHYVGTPTLPSEETLAELEQETVCPSDALLTCDLAELFGVELVVTLHPKFHRYHLRTWEKSDCVYDGVVVDGVLRTYRYCCGLDECPDSTHFGDTFLASSDVLDRFGFENAEEAMQSERWRLLHDTVATELIKER